MSKQNRLVFDDEDDHDQPLVQFGDSRPGINGTEHFPNNSKSVQMTGTSN